VDSLRVQGGYNQVTFIMKRSILWRITCTPSPLPQAYLPRAPRSLRRAWTTKSENDEQTIGDVCVWVLVVCVWWWWPCLKGYRQPRWVGDWWRWRWWRRGGQDNYTRINRIWLLLSGGWWHVRAFVCNGSETVPLNKVYH